MISLSRIMPVYAENESIAKQTAVDRLHISLFTIKSQNETLQRVQTQIQTALIKEFNSKSYWEAVPHYIELTAKASAKDIANLRDTKDHSAVLVGEFTNKLLKVAVRRYPNAKLLGVWSFPLPKAFTKAGLTSLLKDVVDTIVADTPYKGFIVQKRGEQVKINLGKRQTIKKGTVLEVFELDGQSFESEKTRIGKIEIIRVAPEASIAEITSGEDEIKMYNKVTIGTERLRSLPSIQKKYFEEVWLAPTGQLIYIDTRISQETPELRKRQFQLTLSPLVGLSLGWKRLSATAITGSARNSSSSVSFLYGEAGIEVLSRGDLKFGLITSIGGGYAQYSVSNKANAALPLASTAIYYPFLEQAIHYGLSNRARIYGNLQLQFPKFSQDETNGSSLVAGSFGLKSDVGLRLNLSNALSIQNGIQYQFSQWSLKDNAAVAEVIYGINGTVYYRF